MNLKAVMSFNSIHSVGIIRVRPYPTHVHSNFRPAQANNCGWTSSSCLVSSRALVLVSLLHASCGRMAVAAAPHSDQTCLRAPCHIPRYLIPQDRCLLAFHTPLSWVQYLFFLALFSLIWLTMQRRGNFAHMILAGIFS